MRYFKYFQKTWTALAAKGQNSRPGYTAYAFKQAEMFERFATDAAGYQEKAREKCRVYDEWYVQYTILYQMHHKLNFTRFASFEPVANKRNRKKDIKLSLTGV